MSEQDVFEGLTQLALEDLENVPQGEIEHISFCVFMSAINKDGRALGGAFLVDPEIGDIDSKELVESGSIPSITSYVLLRQSQAIINNCITRAVALQDTEVAGVADVEGAKH